MNLKFVCGFDSIVKQNNSLCFFNSICNYNNITDEYYCKSNDDDFIGDNLLFRSNNNALYKPLYLSFAIFHAIICLCVQIFLIYKLRDKKKIAFNILLSCLFIQFPVPIVNVLENYTFGPFSILILAVDSFGVLTFGNFLLKSTYLPIMAIMMNIDKEKKIIKRIDFFLLLQISIITFGYVILLYFSILKIDNFFNLILIIFCILAILTGNFQISLIIRTSKDLIKEINKMQQLVKIQIDDDLNQFSDHLNKLNEIINRFNLLRFAVFIFFLTLIILEIILKSVPFQAIIVSIAHLLFPLFFGFVAYDYVSSYEDRERVKSLRKSLKIHLPTRKGSQISRFSTRGSQQKSKSIDNNDTTSESTSNNNVNDLTIVTSVSINKKSSF